MSAPTLERPMAKPKGRPKKPGGKGIPVRLDSIVVKKARYLATERGEDLSDYLSDLLRPIVQREFRKAGKDLMGGDE